MSSSSSSGPRVVPGPRWPVMRSLQTRVLARSHRKGKLINYRSLSSFLPPSSDHTLTSLPARLIPPYLPMSFIFHGYDSTTLPTSEPSSLLHHPLLSAIPPSLPFQLFFRVSSFAFPLLLLQSCIGSIPTYHLSFPFLSSPPFFSPLSCAYLEQAVVSVESRSITAYH